MAFLGDLGPRLKVYFAEPMLEAASDVFRIHAVFGPFTVFHEYPAMDLIRPESWATIHHDFKESLERFGDKLEQDG